MNKKINKNELKNNCVYYLVLDGVIKYVGITNNPKVREKTHRKNGKVFNKFVIFKTDLTQKEAGVWEMFLIFAHKTLDTEGLGGYNKALTHLTSFKENSHLINTDEIDSVASDEEIEKWLDKNFRSALSGKVINGIRYRDPLGLVDGYITLHEYNKRRNCLPRYCKVCDSFKTSSVWYPGKSLGLKSKICNNCYINLKEIKDNWDSDEEFDYNTYKQDLANELSLLQRPSESEKMAAWGKWGYKGINANI